jgi:hypothetical protein
MLTQGQTQSVLENLGVFCLNNTVVLPRIHWVISDKNPNSNWLKNGDRQGETERERQKEAESERVLCWLTHRNSSGMVECRDKLTSSTISPLPIVSSTSYLCTPIWSNGWETQRYKMANIGSQGFFCSWTQHEYEFCSQQAIHWLPLTDMLITEHCRQGVARTWLVKAWVLCSSLGVGEP